jgi:hypothetical protein
MLRSIATTIHENPDRETQKGDSTKEGSSLRQ